MQLPFGRRSVYSARTLLCALVPLVATLSGCSAGPDDEEAVSTSDEELVVSCGASPTSSVQGFDVSKYQGSFRWSGRGVTFGFTRLAYGTTVDPQFGSNWQNMQDAGVLRGAYQYFLPRNDARTQAELVVAKLGRLGDGDLPAVVDVESAQGVPAATLAAKLQIWLDVVEQGTGKTPIIYTGGPFWETYVRSTRFGRYPLWVAAYGRSCPRIPAGWDRWTFWQYTDGGGRLDRDVFNGSTDALLGLAR